MSDEIECPACGRSFSGSRAFNAHWGYQDDEAHQGDTPDSIDTSVVIDEEHRKKLSEAKKGEERPPEYRRKISETLMGNTPWNKGLSKEDHESVRSTAETLKGRSLSKEHREHISESVREYIEENDVDMSEKAFVWDSENNPFYIHGEYERYPDYGDGFNDELRAQIRERDNHCCQRCGWDNGDQKLHVHHIDRDKHNNDPENLVSLCKTCHGKMEYSPITVQKMAVQAGPNTDYTISGRVV